MFDQVAGGESRSGVVGGAAGGSAADGSAADGGVPAGGRTPARVLADRIMAREARMRAEELGTVVDVKAWLDLHCLDPGDPFARGPAGGAGRRSGSAGTPWVDEYAVYEYAKLRRQADPTARAFMIDVADLEHRFPKLWAAVTALQVPVWQARKIVAACRDLSLPAALKVDAALAATAAGLPWSRTLTLLQAAVCEADPALAERNRLAARQSRYVALCRSQDGIKTMIVRAEQGDVVMVYALVDRLAEILRVEGSTEPADQRRATAFGLLAQPAMVLQLLLRHANDTTSDDTSNNDTNTSTRNGTRNPDRDGEDRDGEDRDGEDRDGEDRDGEGTGQSVGRGASESGRGEPAEPAEPGEPAEPAEPAEPGEPGEPGGDDPWPTAPEPGRTPPDSCAPPDPDAEPPPWTLEDYHEPPDPAPCDRTNIREPWQQRFRAHPEPEPCAPGWPTEPDQTTDPDATPCRYCGRADAAGLRLDLPGLADLITDQTLNPARPKVALNVYLTDHTLATGTGLVRTDHRDHGPMLASQLREFLVKHSCAISVRPILDPDRLPPVDAYEIPHRIRAAIRTRHIASVFPYSSHTSPNMDHDHTRPYTADGTPAQTGVTTLGPLNRGEHNARTHGRWTVTSPHPGVFLWRSPHGYYFLVTNQGTHSLGPLPDRD